LVKAYGGAYRHHDAKDVDPVPPDLAPFLAWARDAFDVRLNSVFVNWYDAALGHYIGRHRDYRSGMQRGSPIVTISLGADRVFRLRPWGRAGATLDFAARDGTVFVIPYDTNLAWTHEVPLRVRDRGRRISVTLRALTGAPGDR
jgi:DNA oxidative demethylase